MHPPRNINEVQRLTRCMATLGHLMSRFTDRRQPFFHVLKRRHDSKWTPATNQTFRELKEYLFCLPKIATLAPGDTLLIYLAMPNQMTSVVLVEERNKKQMLIYYISHTLMEAELNYPLIEKFAYTLMLARRKLHP